MNSSSRVQIGDTARHPRVLSQVVLHLFATTTGSDYFFSPWNKSGLVKRLQNMKDSLFLLPLSLFLRRNAKLLFVTLRKYMSSHLPSSFSSLLFDLVAPK